MRSIELQSPPRARRNPILVALGAVVGFLGSRTSALVLCVAVPALWLVAAWIFVPRGWRAGIGGLFVSSMAIVLAAGFRSVPRWLAALLVGGVAGSALIAGLLTLLASPFLLMMAPVMFVDGFAWTWRAALLAVFCCAPFLSVPAWPAQAWCAWTRHRRPLHLCLALGLVAPVACTISAQVLVNRTVDACIERMLVEDRSAALAAADACPIPYTLASWKPMVRAWMEAKGGPREPENEDSSRIAEAFERLSGIDLRRSYDDSAEY